MHDRIIAHLGIEPTMSRRLKRPSASSGVILIGGAAIAAAIVWVLAYYVSVALARYPDFDGALNLNVAKSLLAGHGYRSFYNEWVPFFPETNGPYVFPAAAAIAVFGVTPFGAQVVNLLYIVAFALLVFAVVARLSNPLVGLVAAFVALQAPGLHWFGMNGYGEIPALCLMLAACLALNVAVESGDRRFVMAGGLLLALSFLTKTVALIWCATTALAFLLADRQRWRRNLLALTPALVLPVALWELYRLQTLDGMRNYREWWRAKFVEILDRAGPQTHLQDTPGFWNKAHAHLRLLGDWLGSPSTSLTVLCLVLVAVAAVVVMLRLRGQNGRQFVFASIVTSAAIYLVWWIFLTPTQEAWLRRILNGLILLELAAILSIHYLLIDRRSVPRTGIAAALALALVAVVAHNHLLWNRPDARPQAAADRELFERVSALPADARLYGVGWYQSPVVAFVTGRAFYDFERQSAEKINGRSSDQFIVLEQVALYQPGFVANVLKRCFCEALFANGAGRIYRVKGVQDDPNLIATPVTFVSPEAALFGAGFFGEEGGMRWAGEHASMRLPASDFTALLLALYVPAGQDMTSAPGPSVLEIYRGDCLVGRRELSSGENGLLISNPCHAEVYGDTLEFRMNGHVRPEAVAPDPRPLAWLFRSMELMPIDAQKS